MQSKEECFPVPAGDARQLSSELCAAELASPFPADWHPHFGASLAVFPRNLYLRSVEAEGAPRWTPFWPDLQAFIEDRERSEMLYAPMVPSAYGLRMIFDKQRCSWQGFLYWDGELVCAAGGESFFTAMLNISSLVQLEVRRAPLE